LHQTEPPELLSAFDVDVAPDALRRAWRKTVRVSFFVDSLPDTVNPAVTERLIHGVGVRDASPS
jgi:hypothetical protein